MGFSRRPELIRGRRASRREVLQRGVVAGSGLTALALVGCNSSNKTAVPVAPATRVQSSAATAAAGGSPFAGAARATAAAAASTVETPKRGGILQYGIDNLQDLLDPHQTTRLGYATIWQNISHHLVGIDPKTGGFTDTEASQSFEQADPTTMVFKLWPKIAWQTTPDIPGRPFTAADVAYNLKRMATKEVRFPRGSQFNAIDTVTAPDDTTVVIKLKQPYAPMLYYLGAGWNVFVNPDAVEKFGSIDRVSAASGIGPFILQTVDKAAGASMTRSPNYFRDGLPYLDGINIVGFTDAQTQIAALRTGKVYIENLLLPSEAEIRSSVKDIQIFPTASPGQYVGPGISVKTTPFADMRVRQAISLAIDRNALIAEGYQGQRAHLLAPVPWGMGDFAIPEAELANMPGYRKDKTQDFQTATQLLAAAGLKPSDVKVTTTVGNLSYYPPTYETVIPQLKKFGFQLEVQVQDNTEFRNHQAKGDYVWQWNLSLVDAEPDAVLRLFNYTGASRNYNGYSNTEVDNLIDQQVQELDHNARVKITRDISKRLIEQPAWIQTANQEVIFAVYPFVRGFRVAPAGTTDAQDMTRYWLAK